MMITAQKYEAINNTLSLFSSNFKHLVKPEVYENLRSAEYVMAVVLGHSRTFETVGLTPEDRTQALESLYDALYR